MKKPKEYIIFKLNELVNIFPNLKCSFRYDNFCETFYIELLPASFYKQSNELKNIRIDILDEFIELYNNESIIFLTEGDFINMEQVEYTVSGKNYSSREFLFKNIDKFSALISEINISLPHSTLAGENNYALAA